MHRTRTPVRAAGATAGRLLSAALLLASGGCVTPHLDGLATAECASSDQCADGLLCVDGVCTDGLPDQAMPPPDMGPDGPPDPEPDVGLDLGPDMRVELDMAPDGPPDMEADGPPDMEADGPPDMEPDGPPDMEPDGPPDMEPDMGCVPVPEICNGADDDCDDRIDEQPDPESPLCPVIPGATLTCIEAACTVQACDAGRVDVDRDPGNGCECVAYSGFDARDLAEPAGLDLDCDGLPGEDPDVAVFVSPRGPADGNGSIGAPYDSLDAALAATRQRAEVVLVLDAGLYELAGPLVLDVSRTLVLAGGFEYGDDGQWRRLDAEGPTAVIDAGALSPAIDVQVGRFGLDDIRLLAANTSAPVGIRGLGCQAIELFGSEVVVGEVIPSAQAGADGQQGGDGIDGAPGEPGQPDGAEAAGGVNPSCATANGGASGIGGPIAADLPADQGDDAPGGATGGIGATVDSAAATGDSGSDGAPGAAGVSGEAGGRWSPEQGVWLSAAGTRPRRGEHGGGGGGGGGGYGVVGTSGASGGGGGAGGCGGSAGQNGTGGFGAFGVVVGAACWAVLEDTVITVPSGGDGGDGAAGGLGGGGAAGGVAGEQAGAQQPAAAGGDGARGGCGGGGAGGSGGPSVGILRVGSDNPPPLLSGATEIRVGAGGVGGAARSNRDCQDLAPTPPSEGEPGIAIDVGCCPADGTPCGDLACDDPI